MNHTPGPWRWYARVDKEYPRGIRSRGGKSGEGPIHIAAVRWGDDTGEANARLIAAAPTLLAELEILIRRVDNGDSIEQGWYEIEHARTTVAYAKGEE